jgi:hypothetical protein
VVAAVLVVANGAAALFRFLVLRAWVFERAGTDSPAGRGRAEAAPRGLMNERQTG